MGLIKPAIIFCIILVLFTYLKSFLEPRLPVAGDGYYHPAFERVADKFRENVKSGKEPGCAFAVYYKGEMVLDMWGGYADAEAHRPWEKDTMTVAFAVTKGVAAIVVAMMVDKGVLDYKRLVADYWPEFAQNGKGNITVEMLMSHQAGLVLLDKPVSLKDMKNNEKSVEESLASQRPVWPPGSAHGYHILTYGLYVDTLIRKADPKGRTTQQVFLEDIAKPFDIDLFMATPRSKWHRVARIQSTESPLQQVFQALMNSRYSTIIINMLKPSSWFARSIKAITEFEKKRDVVYNNPYNRETIFSSMFSTGTARAYAKLYSILGNGGMLGNQRLLSDKVINKLATPLVSGRDVNIGLELSFGPGMYIAENPKGQKVLGHPGQGGQVAYVDLHNQLSVAYLTNYISMYWLGDDPRFTDLEHEVYKCLEEYDKQKS